MSDLQAIADRVEIEALRGEFTDAVMMHDYDRLASLFTPDGAVRIPHVNAEAAARSAASLVRINIAAGAPDTDLSPRAAHATSQARAAVRELRPLTDGTSMSPR